MAKKKEVEVVLTVEAPARMSQKRVAKLLKMCIDIGMNDAAETADDPGLDNGDADDALELEVTNVTCQPTRG